MTEKRFRANFDVSIYDSETEEYISASENGLKEIAKRMNEQQATIKNYEEGLTMKIKKINEQKALITNLQGDVNRLQYIIDELKKDNYKRFEKINELKAKLKEKEEDSRI